MKLTNEQWKVLEPLFPAQQKSPKGGKPPHSTREILQGVLWVMRVGARWVTFQPQGDIHQVQPVTDIFVSGLNSEFSTK